MSSIKLTRSYGNYYKACLLFVKQSHRDKVTEDFRQRKFRNLGNMLTDFGIFDICYIVDIHASPSHFSYFLQSSRYF